MSRCPDIGAIYCLIPHVRAADQTTVDRQEAACRQLAQAAGVPIGAPQVYVDNKAAAWLGERGRPAWKAMLHAARSGEFGHLFLHAPDRLRRLAEGFCDLLDVADEFGIVLHWVGDSRDLNDPAERQLIREEIAQASRSASSASLAARSAHEEAVAAGKPHGGGRRAYGYQAATYRLIDAEAAIVREIYVRFLDGQSLRAIALDLNERSVLTVGGGEWSTTGIARILDAPRYAGLRVFRGEVARTADGTGYVRGSWEPCVSVDQWEQVRALRRARAAASAAAGRPRQQYPLTGLLQCTRCGRHMVGEVIGNYRTYACASKSRAAPDRCTRHIAAEPLEAFVEEAAMRILEASGPGGLIVDPVAVPGAAALPDTLASDRAAQRAIAVRPVDALDGVVTGPKARFAWRRLSLERRAAVLRVLLRVIRIGPSSTSRSVFDPTRIDAVPHPLRSAAEGH